MEGISGTLGSRVFWLNGLTIIALVAIAHFATALLIGERPLANYFTFAWASEVLATMVVPFVLWLLAVVVAAMRLKEPSPLQYLARQIRRNRGRFLTAAALLACYALVNRAYRAIKVAIERIEPFHADPMFVAWDRAVFGTDPWILSHQIIGPVGTQFIDIAYATWFAVILLAFAFAAFSKDRAFQLRACLTYFLIWIVLGNLLAIVWSSTGPVYYYKFFDDDQFLPLTERLASMDLTAVRVQAYLLSTSGDEAIGSGISAMPSVHCAMTMYLVIACYDRWGLTLPFAVAFLYHLIILLGSVHLGWHYAVDGLVSTAAVPLLWWVAKVMLLWEKDAPEAEV
ncbi:MAG: hypothetical protein CVT75_10215 [Alphaproteobacteria bacterium HGW-Alphaproteobacteria-14]|nr:MAG: hypothetical protein CVT75_10215 [Alphaproteobacteria bacterium HGW-Alphaproteobacteria-14]